MLAVALAALLPQPAPGQCSWLPGDGVRGMNGNVNATATWDPDGPGGQPELLVAGGTFTIAGDTLANNIATWNGASWEPLGLGTGANVQAGLPAIAALTVFNGALVAGGDFQTAGGAFANRIARWDGTSWQALGSGMTNLVSALAVYDGELIAGGAFPNAGGVAANRIARWNGTNWQTLGSGRARIKRRADRA